MKKTYKFTALLLSAIISASAFAALPLSASAVENVTNVAKSSDSLESNDFRYSILDDGTAVIDAYIGEDTDVVIPDTIEGKKVSGIGEGAFSYCDSLRKISIPYGVTSIEMSAFEECKSLTTVTIPASVSSIGEFAFSDCASLTTVEIPDGITSIERCAFDGCVSLTSVSIPDSVSDICAYAFEDCASLSSITIPNSVTSIDFEAFKSCKSLKEITIPCNVEYIGDGVFSYCDSLAEIKVDNNNSCYSSSDGVLYKKNYEELVSYPCAKTGSFSIPESVERISVSAFAGCLGIESVFVSYRVFYIGLGAFADCFNLTEIKVDENNPCYSDSDGVLIFKLYNELVQCPCAKTGSFVIPDSVEYIDYNAFENCSGIESVTIPDGIERINDCTFSNCVALKNVSIPESVTDIGNCAFSGCTSLTGIEISEHITNIGRFAFKNCSSLKRIEIPSSITRLGEFIFDGCTSLTEVVIPESVVSLTSYGAPTFSNCTGITNFIVDENNPSYKSVDGVLFNKDGSYLEMYTQGKRNSEYKIPDGVVAFSYYAFSGSPYLRSVTIPESIMFIPQYSLGYKSTNPSYEFSISSDNFDKIDGFTIKGYRGTAAEAYANENGFEFIALGEDIITGDADGNSTVNVNDVTHLQFHISGKKNPDGSPFINTENKAIFDSVDMNKDGKLDVQDVTALQIYIAGNKNA